MKSSELKYPDGDKSQSFRHGLDWDKDQFAICLKKLKSFRNCLDLGGHIGITTIRFSQYFEHVYAFEPVHSKYFKHNTKHLKNVTLFEYAVSDYNGEVDMFINVNNSGGCAVVHEGIIDYLYEKNFVVPTTKFPCVKIDNYNFKDIDFIKMDIEGYNIPALNGMEKLLENNNPVMHIEIGGGDEYSNRFYKLMDKLGYREYAQHGKIDRFFCR